MIMQCKGMSYTVNGENTRFIEVRISNNYMQSDPNDKGSALWMFEKLDHSQYFILFKKILNN